MILSSTQYYTDAMAGQPREEIVGPSEGGAVAGRPAWNATSHHRTLKAKGAGVGGDKTRAYKYARGLELAQPPCAQCTVCHCAACAGRRVD